MTIRAADTIEATKLSRLAVDAKQYWGYSAESMRLWESTLTITEDAIRSNPTFLAEDENGVVGFHMLAVEAGRWELEHLWVDPRWMRRGIGRLLLMHAVEYVRTHGGTSLQIDADPHAEFFYTACGARRIGEVAAPIPENRNRVRPLLEIAMGPMAD